MKFFFYSAGLLSRILDGSRASEEEIRPIRTAENQTSPPARAKSNHVREIFIGDFGRINFFGRDYQDVINLLQLMHRILVDHFHW